MSLVLLETINMYETPLTLALGAHEFLVPHVQSTSWLSWVFSSFSTASTSTHFKFLSLLVIVLLSAFDLQAFVVLGANVCNQVIEYLSKKGYNRTEAMLRVESASQDAEGRPIHSRVEESGGLKYGKAFGDYLPKKFAFAPEDAKHESRTLATLD
jgi:hypothetical protein